MSREWDGSDDRLVLSPGAVSTDGGPISVFWLCRPLSTHRGGLVRAFDSLANGIFNVNPFNDGRVYFGTGQGFTSQPYDPADGWRLLGFTKGDGNAQVRGHDYVVNTATWTHTTLGSVGDSVFGAVASIVLGEFDADEHFHGRTAVGGVWLSVLGDSQVESLWPSLVGWKALSPSALWPFNQASVTDPVLDATGNGADQVQLVGTTVSSDEPAGWSYADTVQATLTATLPGLSAAFSTVRAGVPRPVAGAVGRPRGPAGVPRPVTQPVPRP